MKNHGNVLATILALAALQGTAVSVLAQTTRHVNIQDCQIGATGSLVDPFCLIQECMDASSNGDTCWVEAGTYNELVDFDGKAVEVRSARGPKLTTIDGSGLAGSVVRFDSGEESPAQLMGFSIINGTGDAAVVPGGEVGGGILIVGASPTVINCIVRNNHVVGNYGGAGVFIRNGSPTIINSVFQHNTSNNNGAGIYSNSSNPTLVNCTIADNEAGDRGGGIINNAGSSLTLINCILWGNSDSGGSDESAQVHNEVGNEIVVSHSAIQGLYLLAGDGNIAEDPLFADGYLRLGAGSPCVDSADTSALPAGLFVDLDGGGRVLDDPSVPDSGIAALLVPVTVDMGAYEYQTLGDLDGDGDVDLADYALFSVSMTGPN